MSITLPEEKPEQLLTGEKLKNLGQARIALLDLQMPSFIRGDEDEDAEELFHLSSQPTTPA